MRRCRRVPTAAAALLLGSVLASGLTTACAQPEAGATGRGDASAEIPGTDLGDPEVLHPTIWLCRPGMVDNPCEGSLDATVEKADGSTSVESLRAAEDPTVDCFYVYPTSSTEGTDNAPLRADEAQIRTVRAQAARFAEHCRLFVPVYQQYTIVSLQSEGGPSAQAQQKAYEDVRSAWHDYLINDNGGRGMVLIGHDQGAAHLARLVQEELDPRPALRARLVSALLIGANIEVPVGRDIGGDFQHVPACRRHDQVGCVVAYSAFGSRPPSNAAFGRIGGNAIAFGRDLSTGRQVLCTNPAALGGGPAAINPYLPTAQLGGDHLVGQSRDSLPDRTTPFVSRPGLLRAECQDADGASWLQVETGSTENDPRPMPTVASPPGWGLHPLDINIALGDLVTLVGRQAAAHVNGTQVRLVPDTNG